MTDDDREEGFDPQVLPDDAGDPAAAFEALRETVEDLAADLGREMTTIRKGVEAAFEEFEKFQQPTDYGPDLGRIVQQLAQVGERLQGVEQSPILRNGPQHYAAALERSGEGMVRTAAQQLERHASDLERVSSILASHNRSAFLRKDQDFRMWMAAGVGVIAGVLLLVLLPRFLPFSADSRVAALIMGGDRIEAASAIMNSVDPVIVKKMNWGAQFYDTGGGEITACLEKAKQAGKDQKCAITVPAPEKTP